MDNIGDNMYASLCIFSKGYFNKEIKNSSCRSLVRAVPGDGPVAPAWPVTHLLPTWARHSAASQAAELRQSVRENTHHLTFTFQLDLRKKYLLNYKCFYAFYHCPDL